MLEVRYGKDHRKLADGIVPVYGSGGLMRYAEKSIYNGESILIPRKGTLNNVMRVTGEFWTVDTMFYSVPRKVGAAKYLYYILSDINLAAMNSGSAVPSMTTDILNAIKVVIPSDEILMEFEREASFFWDIIEMNNLEKQKLSQLRDSLLPKLMSGEINVSEVEV
jgi:type I restriction enzyme S subunit